MFTKSTTKNLLIQSEWDSEKSLTLDGHPTDTKHVRRCLSDGMRVGVFNAIRTVRAGYLILCFFGA